MFLELTSKVFFPFLEQSTLKKSYLLQLGLLDPYSTELFDQEARFAEIIQEYELQCRVSGLFLTL